MYKLQKIREGQCISQADLAERSGVPVRVIRAYEAAAPSAHRDINKAEALRVCKMARVLGVNAVDLLEVDDELNDL